VKLTPEHEGYPHGLRELPAPPHLDVSAPLEERLAIAIVGSRQATPESLHFATELAATLARAGVVVVSGGALGIDAAAHRGALAAGGATWVVLPNGRGHDSPTANAALFREIEASPRGRVIWPFPPGTETDQKTPLARNGVLVALSGGVVVVQARLQSGSRNTMSWARDLGRTLWIVPSFPRGGNDLFGGSNAELARAREPNRGDVRALVEVAQLLRELDLDPSTAEGATCGTTPLPFAPRGRPRRARRPRPPSGLTPDEKSAFAALCHEPRHLDQIASRAGLSAASTATALLTLALKDVVVEGPDGLFRLEIGR
jgi:DNA processing protein